MALTSLNGTENKYQQLIHQTWNHLVNFKIVLLQLFVAQNLRKLKKMVTPLSLDFHAPHVLRQIPEIPWREMRPWWPTGFPPSQLPPLTEQSEGNIIYMKFSDQMYLSSYLNVIQQIQYLRLQIVISTSWQLTFHTEPPWNKKHCKKRVFSKVGR